MKYSGERKLPVFLRLINGTQDAGMARAGGLGEVGTLAMHCLLSKPGECDRLEPISLHAEFVGELDIANRQ